MSALTTSWSASDLKTIITTVIATLVAGSIVWSISRLFAKRPNLLWFHESKSIGFRTTDAKDLTLKVQQVVIENVGRAAALNVMIAFPSTEAKFECELLQRNWWSIDYISRKYGAQNYSKSNNGDETVVEFRRIESNEIVKLNYLTTLGVDSDPKGVSFNGELVQKVTDVVWFMNKKRMYWALLKATPATPIIVGILISQAYDLVTRVIGAVK
jgi:hypothetical protein